MADDMRKVTGVEFALNIYFGGCEHFNGVWGESSTWR